MKRLKKNNGFTLIEVIVSIAVLSIIIVPFLSSFTSGFATIINMGHRTKAVEQSQKVMDTIKTREEADVTFLYKIYDTTNPAQQAATKAAFITEINGDMTDGIKLSKVDVALSNLNAPSATNQALFDIANSKLYKVTVTLLYSNDKKSVTLTSLIPQGGGL